MEATPFERTPRGQLAREAATVDPVTFHLPDGRDYTTNVPGEINRLRVSRGIFVSKADAADPVAADDNRFHPETHSVDEVLSYLDERPEDSDRVLAEEKAGKGRKGILGE